MKEDPHKAVSFNCPDPCDGQVYVVGAIIRPHGITFVGRCSVCDDNVSININSLLKEMCNFIKGVH